MICCKVHYFLLLFLYHPKKSSLSLLLVHISVSSWKRRHSDPSPNLGFSREAFGLTVYIFILNTACPRDGRSQCRNNWQGCPRHPSQKSHLAQVPCRAGLRTVDAQCRNRLWALSISSLRGLNADCQRKAQSCPEMHAISHY